MTKRFISALIALTMILSMSTFMVAYSANDVVFSDSFEGKEWEYLNIVEGTSIKIVSDNVQEGKKAIYLVDDSSEKSPIAKSSLVDAKAGESFDISGYIKNVKGNAIKIWYKFYDNASKQLSTGSVGAKGTEWAQVSQSVTAPDGTTKLQIWITGNNKGTASAYVDNIIVTKTSGAKTETVAPETPSTTAPEQTVAPSGDVVFTELFEGKEWEYSNIVDGTSIEIVTDNVQEGKKAIYLVDDSKEKAPIAKSPLIAVKPGENFNITGYIKNVKGNSMKIWYKFFDSASKQLATGNVGASGTNWQKVEKIVTAPEGTANLQIWLTGNNSGVASAYMDNIVVTRVSAAEVEASKPVELITKPEVIDGIPASSDKFHIYLCIGQSNMVGADKVQPEDIVKVDGAYLLNSNGKWETAQPYTTTGTEYMGYNRYSTVAPGTGRMGPTIGFARGMAKKVPEGVKIGIISNAMGGTTIEQWSKGFEATESRPDKNLYENAILRTKEALKMGGELKAIYWLQGESCARKAGYMEKLVKVANGIREEIGVANADVPFIVSEVPQIRPDCVKVLQTAPEHIENSAVVSSKDLTIFDSIHFDFDSQRKLGLRFAETALSKIYGITASADDMYKEIYGNVKQEVKPDNTEYTILVNGKKLESDVPPTMAGDRLFVPIRVIFESLGATVSWDDPTQTVTGVRGDRTVKMQIGDEHMTVNGVTTAMGIAPMLKDSRTLVPIRFVGEGLGAEVGWDEKTNTASITLK